jgi:hypothetical protein
MSSSKGDKEDLEKTVHIEAFDNSDTKKRMDEK